MARTYETAEQFRSRKNEEATEKKSRFRKSPRGAHYDSRGRLIGGYTDDGQAFGSKANNNRQGSPMANPSQSPQQPVGGNQNQPQGNSGPVTTAATGNLLTQRQTLYSDMQKMQPQQVTEMRERASRLGIQEGGWQKAFGTLDRRNEEKKTVERWRGPAGSANPAKASNKGGRTMPELESRGLRILDDGKAYAPNATTASGGDMTKEAMGTPEEQARVQQELQRGQAYASADNTGGVANSLAAQQAAANSPKPQPAAGPQRVLLTPQQKQDDMNAQSVNDLDTATRMRVQGKTNTGAAETQANKRAAALGQQAGLQPSSQGSKFRNNPRTGVDTRPTELSESETGSGYKSVPKGSPAPEGMELIGNKGGNWLYAPMKSVYGESPTTRQANPNATPEGSNRIIKPVVTGQDRSADQIRGDYQKRMGDSFRATGQMPSPQAPPAAATARPAANQRQGYAPGKDPMDRYSAATYDRTKEAYATGNRRLDAEKTVREGGADAMSAGQRKEFGKMYGDTKIYEGAGMTQRPTAPEKHAPRAVIPTEGEYSALQKQGVPWQTKPPTTPPQPQNKSRFARVRR